MRASGHRAARWFVVTIGARRARARRRRVRRLGPARRVRRQRWRALGGRQRRRRRRRRLGPAHRLAPRSPQRPLRRLLRGRGPGLLRGGRPRPRARFEPRRGRTACKAVADGTAQLGVSPMMRVMVAQEAGAKLTLVGQIMQRSGVSMVATEGLEDRRRPIDEGQEDRGPRRRHRARGQAGDQEGRPGESDVEVSGRRACPSSSRASWTQSRSMSFEDLAAIFETPAASGSRLTPDDVTIFDFNSDFVQTAMIPDAIVANNDWLAANEDAAVAFLVAAGRGWAWCRDNQEACAELSRENGATGGASHEAFVLNEALGRGLARVHRDRRDRPNAVGADRANRGRGRPAAGRAARGRLPDRPRRARDRAARRDGRRQARQPVGEAGPRPERGRRVADEAGARPEPRFRTGAARSMPVRPATRLRRTPRRGRVGLTAGPRRSPPRHPVGMRLISGAGARRTASTCPNHRQSVATRLRGGIQASRARVRVITRLGDGLGRSDPPGVACATPRPFAR